jgi:hypothetical protein
LYYSKEYLSAVDAALSKKTVDCFGGPDRAFRQFFRYSKAINFCNDFFLTGGIRGGSEKIDVSTRSFNGVVRKAFEVKVLNIHPGEDPDLSIRLWNLGFRNQTHS